MKKAYALITSLGIAATSSTIVFHALAADEAVPADAAWQKLKDGNLRYVAGQLTHPNQTSTRREQVAKGQKPFAVILSCADSRVGPEVIFDQGLGDLFVVRVAGNILDNAGLGSIEYAVEHLGASLIVVLGHEKCGAVAAAVGGGHAPGHVHSIVKALEPAVAASKSQGGDAVDNAVRSNVQLVSKQLASAVPILSERTKTGKVKVVGARYDLDTGAVELVP